MEKHNAVSDGKVRIMHFNLTKNAEMKDIVRSTYSRAGYSMQQLVLISNNITNEKYFLKLITQSKFLSSTFNLFVTSKLSTRGESTVVSYITPM